MHTDALSNFWSTTLDERPASRPRLAAHVQADVVIVGAGFTGLWTAYYLKRLAPEREIVVLEAERVGHGASGRNGGWVVGNLAGLERHIGDLPLAERQTCCGVVADNVDEVGRVLAHEGIEADFNKGGAIYAAARYRDQVAIQRTTCSICMSWVTARRTATGWMPNNSRRRPGSETAMAASITARSPP